MTPTDVAIALLDQIAQLNNAIDELAKRVVVDPDKARPISQLVGAIDSLARAYGNLVAPKPTPNRIQFPGAEVHQGSDPLLRVGRAVVDPPCTCGHPLSMHTGAEMYPNACQSPDPSDTCVRFELAT